jgi:hypothetical protein
LCVKEEEDVVFIRKVVMANNDMLSLELRDAMPESSVSVRLFAKFLGRETTGER